MKYSVQLLACLLVLNVSFVQAQSFEGMLTLTTSTAPDKIPVMTIKGDKSVLEIRMDSIQTIKLIKDLGAETVTILRTKKDLKYGYRTNISVGPEFTDLLASPAAAKVEVIITQQEKYIGQYRCVKVNLTSPDVEAEAWVTKDLDIKLSTYFPQFFGSDANADLAVIRQLADQEGLILNYQETHKRDTTVTLIDVLVEEKDISIDAFAIDPGFLVLDEEGIKRLYEQAQSDPVKKKQWEEFHEIFGSK